MSRLTSIELQSSQGESEGLALQHDNRDPYEDPLIEEPNVGEDESGELGTFDVFALIVNKMIGTGIYSAPAAVFLITENKDTALVLWGVGFLYTIISMCLYLDFAAAFPYTGGELVYLDEITAYSGGRPHQDRTHLVSRIARKIFGDGLFAYVVYAILFVFVFNSGTNAMQFGRMILLALRKKEEFSDEDLHLIRFIGIVALSVLCLIQYWSPRGSRRLNAAWAVIKIAFVVGLIAHGAYAAMHRTTPPEENQDDSKTARSEAIPESSYVWAKALLAVLFSFEGWENATFVTGEIPPGDQKSLRRGFLLAVFFVGALYLGVVAAYHEATDLTEVQDPSCGGSFFAPAFATAANCGTATQAWAILAAISSLGSLNSIIYTFSRVKQVIGRANVLPWSSLWSSDHSVHQGDNSVDKSPQGGLILHWAMTVAVIASASAVKGTVDSITLPGYLQTYAHALVLLILGLAFLRLPGRESALSPAGTNDNQSDTSKSFRFSTVQGPWKILVVAFLLLFVAANIVLLVFAPFQSPRGGGERTYENWIFAVVLGVLLLVSSLYYLFVFGAAERRFRTNPREGGMEPTRNEEGLMKANSIFTLLRLARVRVVIWKDLEYVYAQERVNRFGRRWTAQYSLHRNLRHGLDVDRNLEPGATVRVAVNLLYWVFGGRRFIEDTPWQVLKDRASNSPLWNWWRG